MATSSDPDAIQRVLYISTKVHVYSIPPLSSNKGHVAAGWTANNNAREIFVARLRVLETSILSATTVGGEEEHVSLQVLLEDPKTGELFAAAPYSSKNVVEAAIDSSRFFAIRVVGDGGQKATLGIGFEDRGEAIDFGICLQEARKVLGLESTSQATAGAGERGSNKTTRTEEKKDWSLKDGQTIKVDLGKTDRRKGGQNASSEHEDPGDAESALFSIKPPPGSAQTPESDIPSLAAPPTAQEARAQKRRSRGMTPAQFEAKQLGFDDGEFGEFQ